MAGDLGSLYFALGLDDKKFNDAIEKAKKKVAELTGEATITVKVDADKVKQEVQDAVKKIDGKEAEVKVGVDIDFAKIENLKARLEESKQQAESLENALKKASSDAEKTRIKHEYSVAWNRAYEIESRLSQYGVVSDDTLKSYRINLKLAKEELDEYLSEYDKFLAKISQKKRLSNDEKSQKTTYENDIEDVKERITSYGNLIKKVEEYRAAVAKQVADANKEVGTSSQPIQQKPVSIKVELDEESVKQVKARLDALGAPITPKVQIEYDQDKFNAVSTTLKNYTERLNELGKVRLGIDDSFLRTGVSSTNGKGVKGWLNKVSDYLLGDDTGDAGKSVKTIQNILDKHTFKIKVDVDAAQLTATVKQKVKKIPVDVDVDLEAVKKKLKTLKVPLDFNVNQAIKDAKTALKAHTFDAKLNLVIDKAKVSKAIKEAFAKQGLNYQATPSDVREARILEIQQKMELRQKKFDGQVKKSNKSMLKLGNSTKIAGDWAGQLYNQFGNLISIYSLERFIRNLYTIGGEFQKQQIALRTMIGDAERGDVIFERMKDLAVKSPFTFSDLSSYTKQMAAYGIEYEELYDTTKRLADISAGVGVDMGRLILAFGQVRSAAVLRGQELRQFTEAGIPLVAELAKRLSEVRGESVKVGEVFDAISKRQVSFDMVKDVLFDMTDPGGKFFEMQEELAKSLAGQWSNLKDAWDIMIADIANSSNNVLSGIAEFGNDAIRNWREWITVVGTVAGAIGAVTTAIRIATVAQAALNAVTSANPWVIAASVIVGAAGAIGGWAISSEIAAENTNQLNTELDEEIQKWDENRTNALRYVDTLKSANTSEERRILLYKELHDLYPEIFKDMEMEQNLLKSTAELKTRINDETLEQQINRVNKDLQVELDKYEELRKKRRIGTSEFVTAYRKPTDDEKIQEAAVLTRIQELQKRKNDIQATIDRAGKIEELKPDSPLSEYIEVYRELGKAVKILRQGGIMGEIANPKEFTTTLEYYDQLNTLLKEQEEIKTKFKPATDEHKDADRLATVYKNAISAIGGVWKTSGRKGGKSAAEEAAERDAKAYLETLKARMSELSSQWDLYKDLFEATGNKSLSMNIAFDGVIPNFDNYISHLEGLMQEEIQKRGLGISVADLLSEGKEGIAKRVNDKSQPAWTEDVAKNLNAIIDSYNNANKKLREESVKNFIEILNSSKDFAQQIADIDRKLQQDLSDLAEHGNKDSEEYKRAEKTLREKAEKDKADVRFKEFKASSDWVKIFDDLDRVATPTLDAMLDKMESFIYQIEESPEAMKEMLDAIGKMREKLSEKDPFGTFSRSFEKLRNINSARWLLAGNSSYTFQQDLYGFKKGQTVTSKSLNDMEQGVFKDISLAVEDTSKAFDNLRNVLDPLIDLFGDGAGVVGKFLDGIGDALGAASNMSNNLSSLMGISVGKDKNLGDVLGIKNAGMWGAIAGAGLSIAGSLMSAFGADYSDYNKMKEEYDNLLGVWDALIDRKQEYIDIDYADEARKVGQEALDIIYKQIDAYKTLGKERLNAGASIGSHSIGVRIKNDMSEEGWDEFYAAAKNIGFSAAKVEEGRMEGLFNLTADQLTQLQEQAPVFWAKLDEDVREYLENIIASNEALEDMRDTLNETLTGTALDAFYDDYISMLSDLDTSNQDFAQSFEEYLKNAIIANVIGNKYRDAITKLYEDWAKMSDSDGDGAFDLTPEESEALRKAQEGLTEQLIAEREALKEAFGWTSESSSSSGLSSSVQGVTEDTADLLASYVNAIRSDCSVERSLVEKLIAEDIPRINYLVEAQLTQLNAIAANTLRNANAADKIYDLMNRMSDKGSNKWRI